MPQTKVTVVIPTYNRASLLKISLKSVLDQDYPDFQAIVLDNASSDETEVLVKSLADSRITYVKNNINIGLYGNWNRALELNNSPYLLILPDDDRILPSFLRESVMALEKHPEAAFSTCLARYINAEGDSLDLQAAGELPSGYLEGWDYLHHLVADSARTIHPATVMMRSSALQAVGGFQVIHAKQLLDLNLFIRLAARYGIIFLSQELAQVRQHPQQAKEQEFQLLQGTKTLAELGELIDAIAYLFESPRAEDTVYRHWLKERLLSFNCRRGELTRTLIPSLNLTWREHQAMEAQLIASVIPQGETFIWVNDSLWVCESVAGRKALPFLEQKGQYKGLPPNDQTTIQELERMRHSGANFIVFNRASFWWLDYYGEFHQYLRSHFPCIMENECLIVFHLKDDSTSRKGIVKNLNIEL